MNKASSPFFLRRSIASTVCVHQLIVCPGRPARVACVQERKRDPSDRPHRQGVGHVFVSTYGAISIAHQVRPHGRLGVRSQVTAPGCQTNGVTMPGPDLEDEDVFDIEADDFIALSMTKSRKYRHFDSPIDQTRLQAGFTLRNSDPTHRFLPLLGYTDQKRRVYRDSDKRLRLNKKPRPIRFASHEDAAYLQAYAQHLSTRYERTLAECELDSTVLAYRPTGLTNIHHAKSLFDEILEKRNCTVTALDISGFFDTLSHSHLKQELADMLGTARLQGHDWAVFSNMTRYSWVEIDEIDQLLGKERALGDRICTPQQFKDYIRGTKGGLVQVHDYDFGIPQGTPISGLYANIYMQSFDKAMRDFTKRHGGSYRRYSDDIAIVLPNGDVNDDVVDYTQKLLADYALCLSEDKTDRSTFSGEPPTADQSIQYLGFTFDGRRTLIRSSSINLYRKKMRRGIHAKIVAAKMNEIAQNEIHQREARSRYTHVGKRRNFLKYAYRAADILDAPEIREQVKRHVTWFERSWKREIFRVYGELAE